MNYIKLTSSNSRSDHLLRLRGRTFYPHRARYFPDDLYRALDLLTRRELIEPADGGYRFQVELIRRWFARQVE